MHHARSVLSFVACAAFVGFAHAGEPQKLDKADLEKVLAGKTINYTNINGSSANVTFEKEGRVTYKTGNSRPSIGTWQAGEDGRYCIKVTTGNASDHCRRVWKTDTGYSLSDAQGALLPVTGLD